MLRPPACKVLQVINFIYTNVTYQSYFFYIDILILFNSMFHVVYQSKLHTYQNWHLIKPCIQLFTLFRRNMNLKQCFFYRKDSLFSFPQLQIKKTVQVAEVNWNTLYYSLFHIT